MNKRQILDNTYFLATILCGLHTALFAVVALLVVFSSDSLSIMLFYVFYYLDYPFSRLTLFEFGLGTYLIGGGLLWFCYGMVIQTVLTIRSRKSPKLLLVPASIIIILFLLPWLYFKTLPDWEQHWERGTAYRESGKIDLAIEYVRKATELVPRDSYMVTGIWDYLGRLYLEENEYQEAGQAFHQVLTIINGRPNTPPVEFLNAHNQLTSFYEKTGDRKMEKYHLRKSIEYNRLVYNGDSTQEAHCWHRLAEIHYEERQYEEAIKLQSRAISIESGLPLKDEWFIGYMNRQLEEWKSEQLAEPRKM